ncbi:XtmB Phage terminase large subunit [uncultured Caudovirales phage]|uniref:XtmB Phage terminase large subunit n=1 Tax=uncultured Caudovirales phage TaxID=2100421 RepID=A0A6J5KY05_9CAUD|nr:XtmB Phage terminase large subunit [uncultured Caudovirales phage]
MYTVKWCEWDKIINSTFLPLVNNTDRYLIMYGSRGSSKSDFTAKKLIYRCLTENYFRYILVRNTYNTIKDSQFKNIKDTVYSLGLQDLFHFKISPYEITCINGNEFLARGCDEPEKLKSLKDPTGVWWEEDIPEENDFKVITKTIRTTKTPYLQEIFTINPEVVGEYAQHWFFKKFFTGHYPAKMTFRDTQIIELDDVKTEIAFTCHHSTVKDNRWASNEYKAMLFSETDSHRYKIDALGLWSTKITGGNIYKKFNSARNTAKVKYNPRLPIHLSWDENMNPYLPCGVFQIEDKEIRMIDLILGRNPDNTVKAVSNEFKRKYPAHTSGLFIYGDATSQDAEVQKASVKGEEGFDMFDLIRKNLKEYNPTLRVNRSNPNVIPRVNFVNSIFESNEGGITFIIDKDLTEAITDFEQTKEAPDGRKAKVTVKDPSTGITYQPYGHITDLSDYIICYAFSKEYEQYKNGSSGESNLLLGVTAPNERSNY